MSAFKDLAPSGTLRVGVAVGPTIEAGLVAIEKGKPRGIAVDLGTGLARRLGVPVRFVSYPGPGPLVDAAAHGNWDVAFVAVDEEKKKLIDYGAAYIVGQFTVAIAVPKGRSAGLAYASAFVEDVKASGVLRRSLDNVGLTTTRVAPAVKP